MVDQTYRSSSLYQMKGIVLAGGSGSRLWPITRGMSKQLLPVYDKPLVHYPLATLMLAGINDILIITTPEDQPAFKRLLSDGSDLGIQFQFATQEQPNGLAEAFIIGKDALILGDNIFHGAGLGTQLKTLTDIDGASIFAYKVSDPERYGVVEFGDDGQVISIEEKPIKPKSKFAIPGLYFYDQLVIEIAKTIQPSARGELEITSINQEYLKLGKLKTSVLERGTAWLDTGTFDSFNAAAAYVKVVEERQGDKIACLEEIAWRNKWISDSQLVKLAEGYKGNSYGNYLKQLL
jgi:glucose-1-phosphate thymidylyltransferase